MNVQPKEEPTIEFKFIEFNRRRAMRGAQAARVEIIDGEDIFDLWMSPSDINKNIKEFGRHPELIKALEAYR